MTCHHLKFLLLFLSCILGALPSKSQNTWSIGATTLTEYDLVTDLNLPWEIVWGPDDYIWCTLRSGSVLHINPATGEYLEILKLEVTNQGSGESGLLGMCFHPLWPATKEVFLVYNQGSTWNQKARLSAWQWDGESLSNERILIDNLPAGAIHNGSRLISTADYKILMSTGDTGDGGLSSQDSLSLNGKILRINPDGSIPSDNPFGNSLVYSWGHRNPQGLCNGPNGHIYSSEHGQSTSDELNLIEAGRNYGWPFVEGACDNFSELAYCDSLNVKEPLIEWTPTIAVNGIEYYHHPAIPEWNNSILMAALGGLGGAYKRLAVLHLNADGSEVLSEEQFFKSLGLRVRDICVNPYTGAVYIAFNGASYPGSGPNQIKEFRNDAYVGIDRTKAKSAIKIFPNPGKTHMSLSCPPNYIGARYTVYNLLGEPCIVGRVEQSIQALDTDKLSPGSYVLSLEPEKMCHPLRFVVLE